MLSAHIAVFRTGIWRGSELEWVLTWCSCSDSTRCTFSTLYSLLCPLHQLTVCLQTIGRQCSPVRNALDLGRGIADLIRYCPKWSSLFGALQAQLVSGLPSLMPLCPTRWIVYTSALQSILSNYPIVQGTLQQVNAESMMTMGVLLVGILLRWTSSAPTLVLNCTCLI